MKYSVLYAMLLVWATTVTCSEETLTSFISTKLYNLGEFINKSEFPLLGKLEGILPFAVVSYCLQNFPGQAILFSTAALSYVLYHNDTVRNFFAKYTSLKQFMRTKKSVVAADAMSIDDDFFIFDEEILLDTQDEYEDELLNNDDEEDEIDSFERKETDEVFDKKELRFL